MSVDGVPDDLPGRPDALFGVADEIVSTMRALDDLFSDIAQNEQLAPDWHGRAHDAFIDSTAEHKKTVFHFFDGLDQAQRAICTYAEILKTLQSKNDDLITRAHERLAAAEQESPPVCPVMSDIEEDHAEYLRQAREAAHECAALLREALRVEKTVLKNDSPQHTVAVSSRKPLSHQDMQAIIAALADGGSGLDPDDLAQGMIGDCYFLASLRSVMAAPGGRAFIAENVRPWPSADDCKGFMVTLYDDPANPDENQKRTVFVDSVHPYGASRDDSSAANIYSVYEAAYGQYRTSVAEWPTSNYLGAGLGVQAMADITASPSPGMLTNIPGVPGDGFGGRTQFISAMVNAGLPVTATTQLWPREQAVPADIPGEPAGVQVKIPQAHVYSVIATDENGITLANPWGRNSIVGGTTEKTEESTFTLSWEDFNSTFLTVDIGAPVPEH